MDYEDFGSLVLLECEEQRQAVKVIDELELQRMLDRIRHRLVRKARREVPLETAEFQTSKTTLSPESLTAAVQEFASRLSPIEGVVFELRCIQNHDIGQVIRQTGLSQATVYRTLKEVRRKFTEFVSQR